MAAHRVVRVFSGYYEYDGFVEAMPMMRRAVAETRAHLERAGHTLVRIEPPGVTEAFYLFMQAVLVDNGAYIVNNLKQVATRIFEFSILIILRFRT